MPQGENFWNPYRWVTVSNQPIQYEVPSYHHTLSGLSGRLWCELEALTPLLIGDGGSSPIEFVRRGQIPYIPATSLKGAIRSLAEVVGNAAVPFPKIGVDAEHELARARITTDETQTLDTVARTFGYLHGGNVVAGLIHFSDAQMTESVEPPNQWQRFDIVVGQPKREHEDFYPGKNRRKFYHHHPGTQELTTTIVRQKRSVRPAPPGTRFQWTVDFTNLRDEELNLLLYCLVLEEQVSVTLSPAALGSEPSQQSVTLQGPLRHKIGGAKPHGAGSVHIRITKMELRTDAAARYRGESTTDTWEADTLMKELSNRTASFQNRTERTMRELRAMLIYTTEDPRRPIRYPNFRWFRQEQDKPRHEKTPLKPTI